MVDTTDLKASTTWQPISDPLLLKLLGKLSEEIGELNSAIARCIIQGVDGVEPVTDKLNRVWLEDEIADVAANIQLVTAHLCLNTQRMDARTMKKISFQKIWHTQL